jgi:cytoskeletal protein CcmA (bactofilin family)
MSNNMDMRISGSGKVPAGEYNHISISGSGSLVGAVRCATFSSSGASHGENIECADTFKVSGASSFSGTVKANYVGVSGSFSCGGDLVTEEKLSVSGSAKCKGNVKGNLLSIAGALQASGDVEGEKVKVKGILNCGGLLNAEDIEIEFERGMEIGSIGGSKIVIFPKNASKPIARLPLFSALAKRAGGGVSVITSIEGDEIALEGVTCPRVTGRIVAIERGCNIDLVQYSETVEISPDAKVGRTEKI